MNNPYEGSHEALVVALARKGERDAFAELVRRRQGWLRALMYRSCGDAETASDLAQQGFLQAFRRLDQLQDNHSFAAWLKKLTIHEWLQTLRKRDALAVAEDWLVETPAPEGKPGLALDLDSALALLPEPVRLCIVLAYHEGMAHGEIAEATDIALGTVKSHIRRGTAKLREQLNAYSSPGENQ